MRKRSYYSVRTGKLDASEGLSLEELREFFVTSYTEFEEKGFFQERLGINCTDGYIAGTVGDVELYSFRVLRRKGLFPIWQRKEELTEDEIFDLIEFLYDHASQPIDEGHYHSFCDCGYHFSEFIKGSASDEFRASLNDILKDYGEGFELSKDGEILTRPGGSLDPLLQVDVPGEDPKNIAERVETAVKKFRQRSSSWDQRRDAIRDLADVLEFLRPELKQVLNTKDEAALFEIANNFGIRHHNLNQKTDYDQPIWLSWIFYFYLATIHAATRMIEKKNKTSE
ncbi:MAG: hypothetical protein KDD64_14855 [Bdellovibrionales bacterium]|nr:hypothetical protein [Bdellovibrionales bacterium]